MSIVEASWVPKEISRRPMAHYDARLERRVDVEHNDLFEIIETIQTAASGFVDFTPLGKLGIALCDLGPVVKNVLGDKKGNIEGYAKKDFEQELIGAIDLHPQPKIVAPVQGDYSFALYGNWYDELGIRLVSPNPLLIGERFMAESYIKDTYDVSPRFASGDLMQWEPHITLGRVRYEQLAAGQRDALQEDPTRFISAIVESPERLSDPEVTYLGWAEPLEIPDIALGGLRVVCDRQPSRIL